MVLVPFLPDRTRPASPSWAVIGFPDESQKESGNMFENR
jgi:hypothetical protein